jgi:hypothetical protein
MAIAEKHSLTNSELKQPAIFVSIAGVITAMVFRIT